MAYTVKRTMTIIRDMGLTASHRDGEYRVNFKRSDPRYTAGTAYFTTDADDAIGTANHMATHNRSGAGSIGD